MFGGVVAATGRHWAGKVVSSAPDTPARGVVISGVVALLVGGRKAIAGGTVLAVAAILTTLGAKGVASGVSLPANVAISAGGVKQEQQAELTERRSPSSILALVELSGSVSAIQDDPDAADASWLTATGGGAGDCRVDFPPPSGTLSGTQEFRVLIRKNSSGGNNVSWALELWDSGALVSSVATGVTSSLAGEVVFGTWTGTPGSVECRVVQTDGHGGNPNGRRYIELGAIEWNVRYLG